MRLLATLLVIGALALAGQSSASKNPAPKSKSSAKSASKKSSSKKKRAPRVPKQTQPDAQRSLEIQQALAREGFLKSTPSGKWDAATSDAFGRYQAAQGYPVTGKPDALSLKKLGLGYKPENQVNQ